MAMTDAQSLLNIFADSKSRELFVFLFEQDPKPKVIADRQGQLVYANKAYLDMLETIIEDVRGDGWKPYIHPECRDAVYRRWEDALAGKENPNYDQTVTYQSKSGKAIRKHVKILKYNGSNFIAYID